MQNIINVPLVALTGVLLATLLLRSIRDQAILTLAIAAFLYSGSGAWFAAVPLTAPTIVGTPMAGSVLYVQGDGYQSSLMPYSKNNDPVKVYVEWRSCKDKCRPAKRNILAGNFRAFIPNIRAWSQKSF